jgi:hypothetical protein
MKLFRLTLLALLGSTDAVKCGEKDGVLTRYFNDACNEGTQWCSDDTLDCTDNIADGAVCGNVINKAYDSALGVCGKASMCAGDDDADVCIPLLEAGDQCATFGTGCGPVGKTLLICDQTSMNITQTICKERGQAPGTFCTNDKTCGGYCARASGSSFGAGLCKAFGKNGDACTSASGLTSDQCEERCDTATKTCVAYKLQGETCENSSECCPGLASMMGCSCDDKTKKCQLEGAGFATTKSTCNAEYNFFAAEGRCTKMVTAALCPSGCFWCATAEPNDDNGSRCQWAPEKECQVETSSPLSPGNVVTQTFMAGKCETIRAGGTSGATSLQPTFTALVLASGAFAFKFWSM